MHSYVQAGACCCAFYWGEQQLLAQLTKAQRSLAETSHTQIEEVLVPFFRASRAADSAPVVEPDGGRDEPEREWPDEEVAHRLARLAVLFVVLDEVEIEDCFLPATPEVPA